MLEGKKTYIISALMFLWGAVGWAFGWLEPDQAMHLMMESGALSALRAGVKKLENGRPRL